MDRHNSSILRIDQGFLVLGGKGLLMVRVIERSGGRYEVQDVEFGQVYKWCPECVVIECDCGEMTILTPSAAACGCGADHAALVRGKLDDRQSGDKALHPWRYAGDREGLGIPF